MKRIIDGKRYDTDTAKVMAEASSEVGRSDFNWWEETLYLKKTGEFFLYGEGGPASRYARPTGVSSWCEGERLMPLTVDEAKEWAEENLDGDEYESIFGEVEEEDTTGKRTVTFSLHDSVILKIARLAEDQGCTKSEVIERLVKNA